jgi:hypothetical protein
MDVNIAQAELARQLGHCAWESLRSITASSIGAVIMGVISLRKANAEIVRLKLEVEGG